MHDGEWRVAEPGDRMGPSPVFLLGGPASQHLHSQICLNTFKQHN